MMNNTSRLREINSQAIRDLVKVTAGHKWLNEDKVELLLEIEELKKTLLEESAVREEEITLKDHIMKDYELVLLELSSRLSKCTVKNNNNSG